MRNENTSWEVEIVMKLMGQIYEIIRRQIRLGFEVYVD